MLNKIKLGFRQCYRAYQNWRWLLFVCPYLPINDNDTDTVTVQMFFEAIAFEVKLKAFWQILNCDTLEPNDIHSQIYLASNLMNTLTLFETNDIKFPSTPI